MVHWKFLSQIYSTSHLDPTPRSQIDGGFLVCVIATTTQKGTIMPSPREGGGNIRLRLDSELAAALDRARDTTNVTRTSYTRTALIRAIRAAGHLPTPGQNAEAAR